MMTLLRATERDRFQNRKVDIFRSFYAGGAPRPFANNFGVLEGFAEERLQAGAAVPQSARRDAEIITYVRTGALAHEDSMGRSGVVHAGEFQHMTSGRRVRHGQRNASLTDSAQVFQMWLRPSQADLDSTHEQKRFSAAQRRGGLCVVASPDGRRGSLRVHQDSLVFASLLDPGQHVVHELAAGRSAWLHLVEGNAMLNEVLLTTGDGAAFTDERAVSLTAHEATEILLLDLGPEIPPSRGTA
jgi:redox-sensitive bicupin YhaK (pirin superfamily)